jgi:hypothetical protein
MKQSATHILSDHLSTSRSRNLAGGGEACQAPAKFAIRKIVPFPSDSATSKRIFDNNKLIKQYIKS